MKNALRINVENQTIEQVQIGDWTTISVAIGNGCHNFCCPVDFDNMDTIYADDESLLRYDDIKGGFMMEDWSTPLVGNAIIMGTDEDGESIDAKTTIAELEGKIKFLTEEQCKRWASYTMSQPMQIYSF